MPLISRRRTLDLETPAVMGVINVTPDSFSDGGHFSDIDLAFEQAMQMLRAGASIIDLGGESTRPGSQPVPAAQQIDRVLPLLERLRPETHAFISVDTSSSTVIDAAASAGADLINDVYALRQDDALQVAADSGLAVCLMHMQGTPATMQDAPRYDDPVADILRFLEQRVGACVAAGMDTSRLLIDPGFGFGKTDDHNMQILAGLDAFAALGCPLLIGVSRKGTLGNLTGRSARGRLAAGLAAAVVALERGARVVRTHDVPETIDAIKIVNAVNTTITKAVADPAG